LNAEVIARTCLPSSEGQSLDGELLLSELLLLLLLLLLLMLLLLGSLFNLGLRAIVKS